MFNSQNLDQSRSLQDGFRFFLRGGGGGRFQASAKSAQLKKGKDNLFCRLKVQLTHPFSFLFLFQLFRSCHGL